MARKKDFKNSPLNPFAAAEAAATEILGIIPEDVEQTSDNNNIADVDNVVNVEQQKQHHQQNQQEKSSTDEQQELSEDVDGNEQQLNRAGDKPSTKTPKRTFPGRQHMHLILPNELAEAVKLLAKIQNKSVNIFMIDLINTHMEDWKPIVDQLGRLDKNIGVKSSKKKLL